MNTHQKPRRQKNLDTLNKQSCKVLESWHSVPMCASCPYSPCEFIWTWTRDVQWCPEAPWPFRDRRCSEYLPQIIWATIPAICGAAGKQMLFFHLWNQVVGLQSALWAASGKRWLLKWQCCLCAFSRLVLERRGLPATPNWTMKHDCTLAQRAICSELLSARSAAHHQWSSWWITVAWVAFGRFAYIRSWHFELRWLITWLICVIHTVCAALELFNKCKAG